jgi:hypothetical protein
MIDGRQRIKRTIANWERLGAEIERKPWLRAFSPWIVYEWDSYLASHLTKPIIIREIEK